MAYSAVLLCSRQRLSVVHRLYKHLRQYQHQCADRPDKKIRAQGFDRRDRKHVQRPRLYLRRHQRHSRTAWFVTRSTLDLLSSNIMTRYFIRNSSTFRFRENKWQKAQLSLGKANHTSVFEGQRMREQFCSPVWRKRRRQRRH